MTLDEAVEVLNRERHRSTDCWEAEKGILSAAGEPAPPQFVCAYDRYDTLEVFEAVAIAEKYERARKTMSNEDIVLCESCGRPRGPGHLPWCKMHGVDPPHRRSHESQASQHPADVSYAGSNANPIHPGERGAL